MSLTNLMTRVRVSYNHSQLRVFIKQIFILRLSTHKEVTFAKCSFHLQKK